MVQLVSLNLSRISLGTRSSYVVVNYVYSMNFFMSTVRFSGHSKIYKKAKNVLVDYERFRWLAVSLMYLRRTNPIKMV